MSASLSLDEMSVEEKIAAMEALWEDLCIRAPDRVSPQWHGATLAERRTAVERGMDQFEDWEIAKKQINDRIS